jgi:hypothetical protein
VPTFNVTVTATLTLDSDDERRSDQLTAIETWASEQGHERGVQAPSDDSVVVSEIVALTAPSHSDAQRIALSAFGARAFDASLPAGPRRLLVDIALSD